ncbi:MAG: DUF3592 domain-containing protein [Chthoniobacterales bacterium]
MIFFHRQIREIREKYGHHVLQVVRVFFPIFAIASFLIYMPRVMEAWRSRDYVEVQGQIMRIEIGKFSSKGTTTFTLHMAYDYAAGDQRYHSERFDSFGNLVVRFPDREAESGAQRLVQKYHEGALVPVWVDPKDPSRAVLEKGIEPLKGHMDDLVMVPVAFVVSVVLWCIPLRIPRREDALTQE